MTQRTLLRTLLLASVLASTTPALAQRRISNADAERIALREVPNGTVTSIDHDREGRREVIEVEVRDASGIEHELVLDAETGEVLRREVDDD